MPTKAGCSVCGGRFGLISYRHWEYRFCSKKCKRAHYEKVAKDRERIKNWFAFLSKPP